MISLKLTGLGCVLLFLAGVVPACSNADGGTEQLGAEASGLDPQRLLAGHNGGQNICTLTYQGNQVVRYVTVKESGFSFEETRTVNVSSPGGGATTSNGIVKQGSQQIYSYSASAGPDGKGSVAIDWGTRVRGMDAAHTEFANGVLTGTVNGRAFQPFHLGADPATAVFVDGKPAPSGSLPGQGTRKQLERLEAKISDVIADCEVVTTLSESASAQAVTAFALVGNDPGHPSDTYSTFECDGCKGAVVVGATVTCGLTCAFTLGIGCPVCIAGAAVAVPTAILACEQSGACCPQACGGGFPGTCCFGDEECLNRQNGLCCSPGTRACEGGACCRQGESCIDTGTLKGSCCKDELLSGNKCCDEGEVPFGANGCCATGKQCGSACCGGAEDILSYCMNAATSTCCSSLQKECNGVCCPQGQDCISGACTVVVETCQHPCQTQADCTGDSHLRCHADINCCVYTPF